MLTWSAKCSAGRRKDSGHSEGKVLERGLTRGGGRNSPLEYKGKYKTVKESGDSRKVRVPLAWLG